MLPVLRSVAIPSASRFVTLPKKPLCPNNLWMHPCGYFEKIDGNKHLMLVPTNENKEIMKEYGELWSKIKYLIRSVTKNISFDEKYKKIKLNSNDDLPLNKTLKCRSMI